MLQDVTGTDLTDLLDDAEQIAATWCNWPEVFGVRQFRRRGLQETITLDPTEPVKTIWLSQSQATIQSVTIDETVLVSTDYATNAQGRLLFKNYQCAETMIIDYDAGYLGRGAAPDTEATDAVVDGPLLPGSLIRAVLLIASHVYQQEASDDALGVVATSHTQDDVKSDSIRYDRDSIGRTVPREALTLLEPFTMERFS